MWDKIKQRFREPSTYAGLAALTVGVGQVAKINEAPQVADVIGQAGQAAVAGDWVGAGTMGLLGLLSIFMREKGGR
jgi:purine-cytosine permease-like protein